MNITCVSTGQERAKRKRRHERTLANRCNSHIGAARSMAIAEKLNSSLPPGVTLFKDGGYLPVQIGKAV